MADSNRLVFVLETRVSLCSSGWFRTCFVNHIALNLTEMSLALALEGIYHQAQQVMFIDVYRFFVCMHIYVHVCLVPKEVRRSQVRPPRTGVRMVINHDVGAGN